MEHFIANHKDRITGVLSGFDRLVFRGTLRPISYVQGLKGFLWRNQVLLKDFGPYAQNLTNQLKDASLRSAQKQGRPVSYLASSDTDKEAVDRRIAERDKITSGLIAVLTCVEPCTADGAETYTLTLSTAPDNPPTLIAESNSSAGLTATVTGLTPNTTYYGFVIACNANGCGAHSALGTAVTLAAVPQGLTYTGLSALGVTVSFSANRKSPGTVYEIERAGGAANPLVFVTTNTTASFTGLVLGTSYTVRVRAVDHGGQASAYSETLSLTTTGAGPAVPTNLRGSLGTGDITYAWDPVTRDTNENVLAGTVTYRLFQSNAPSGPFTTEWAATVEIGRPSAPRSHLRWRHLPLRDHRRRPPHKRNRGAPKMNTLTGIPWLIDYLTTSPFLPWAGSPCHFLTYSIFRAGLFPLPKPRDRL